MERSVIVGWVIRIKSVFGHLIDEPTIDSLIEMRGFKVQTRDSNKRCQEQDQHRK